MQAEKCCSRWRIIPIFASTGWVCTPRSRVEREEDKASPAQAEGSRAEAARSIPRHLQPAWNGISAGDISPPVELHAMKVQKNARVVPKLTSVLARRARRFHETPPSATEVHESREIGVCRMIERAMVVRLWRNGHGQTCSREQEGDKTSSKTSYSWEWRE